MVKRSNRIESVSAYYFAEKLAEIKRMQTQGADIINLGVGSPDLPPPTIAHDTLVKSLEWAGVHSYQPYKGITELRTGFAKWYLSNFDVKLNSEEEILPLIGSKEGIMHISMAFLDDGDHVLVPDPGYPAYKTITKLAGATPVMYKLSQENNYLPDIQTLRSQDLTKVKIMWINYPHMPTGAKATRSIFKELVALAKENNFLICNDNPYALILNENPLSLFNIEDAESHCIELCSLSKHFNMPGWRVGAVIANSRYISDILTFKSNMDSGMFKPLQIASSKVLELDNSWINDMNAIYTKRKNFVYALLDKLECTYEKDQAGLFVWAKVSGKWKDGLEMSEYLLHNKHIFITPGMIFGDEGRDYVRVSICQNDFKLKEAINRCK